MKKDKVMYYGWVLATVVFMILTMHLTPKQSAQMQTTVNLLLIITIVCGFFWGYYSRLLVERAKMVKGDEKK